ncbi:hypothetical protein [Desulforamulus ferrireducens]|uniref:Uncharacterized protein n=1 Tax=Desulforamulus ferrireducens TaxID=1833852 RepID=A0A1S6IYR7_9FIRM|nr:hypothetical protein [Desulforamulus ferrireducens]AQS59923.1 hypothetical protein B0537_13050 [Desulforamulus ferrireducens]
MKDYRKELEFLLASDAFKNILNADVIKLCQLNAVLALLVKVGIPFDLAYSPGTRREAAAIELVVFINPTTTLNSVLDLEPGGSIFSGNILP